MRRTPNMPCLNCGDPTVGDYCRNCGQAKRRVVVSVRNLIRDVIEDQLVLSMKLPRTLLLLVTKPGFLTVEYVNGRIVRYVAPFRLYLATSVLFFLLLSFFGLRAFDRAQLDNVKVRTEGSQLLSAGREQAIRALQAIDTADMSPRDRAELAAAVRRLQAVDSVRSNASAESADTSASTALAGLQPWAITLSTENSDNSVEDLVRDRLIARYGHLPGREAVREFLRECLEYAPQMIFLLLPVFALLLKLLYVRRKRFYAEHFVFALHVHAFTFLVFIPIFAIGNWLLTAFLLLGLMLYYWLAMKRVYGQGWLRTTLKYWILNNAYLVLFCFGVMGTVVVTLLLA